MNQLSKIIPPTGYQASARGYAGVCLTQPKTNINVGSVLRIADCYGLSFVAHTGQRYSQASTDTMKAHRRVPLFRVEDAFDAIPFDCVPVAVDLVDGATTLPDYEHPQRAVYIFGPEDGTLGKAILDRCRDRIVIPTKACLNLAVSVATVMYDRQAKICRR